MPAVPSLLPRPRRIEVLPGISRLPATLGIAGIAPGLLAGLALPGARVVAGGDAWCRCAIDAGAVREPGDEAYRLVLDDRGAQLAARTATGLRRGLATLAQLIRGAVAGALPAVAIDDAPVFAVRGVMLDISRDRIPTLATLRALVDDLVALKVNHLQLYCEHAVAYAGHEAVWRAADALSGDDLRALDTWCSDRGVALTANQNCLGHMERWLRVPAYAALGEVEQPWISPVHGPRYVEPSTLCPTDPRSLELVGDLLRQLVPLCSGGDVNIGCDEPWDIGQGRSAAACAQRGAKAVFSAYVTQVAALAHGLGKRPQFWCDPQPNEDDALPRDLVALVWGYEYDADFAGRLAAHRAAGRETWVCPGTSTWLSSTSRTWNRRGNLDAAATQGTAHGARGFLVTEWGDRGHRQQWPLTRFGLAEGAHAAWHGAGGYDAAAAGQALFGDAAIGTWLERLGQVDEGLCRGSDPVGGWRRRNRTALWHELDETHLHEITGVDETSAWQAVRERLDTLGATLPAGADALIGDELHHAHAVAAWTADRALWRRSRPTIAQRQELAAGMAALIGEHRQTWLARCRYGGLEDSCAWYRRHAERW